MENIKGFDFAQMQYERQLPPEDDDNEEQDDDDW